MRLVVIAGHRRGLRAKMMRHTVLFVTAVRRYACDIVRHTLFLVTVVRSYDSSAPLCV